MSASQPAAPARPPAKPKDGKYHCVLFISGTGLQTVPGFTLRAGKYTHDGGTSGTTRYDAATGVIEFVGGALTGQAGKVEPRHVRLFNERRTRTVIDCDTP